MTSFALSMRIFLVLENCMMFICGTRMELSDRYSKLDIKER